MFEKFKERFDWTKSDDMFIEAAIDSNARQKYIDNLMKTRAYMQLASILGLVAVALSIVRSLLDLLSSNSHFTFDGFYFSMFTVVFVITSVVDLQIKFLKALEAGAKQAAPTES